MTIWYSSRIVKFWNGEPAEPLTSICTGSFSPIEVADQIKDDDDKIARVKKNYDKDWDQFDNEHLKVEHDVEHDDHEEGVGGR